jgi:hypothetical protein
LSAYATKIGRSLDPAEIENDTDRAIETAVDGLSPGFPERIVSSVIEGLHRRLFAPGDDVKTPQNLRIL